MPLSPGQNARFLAEFKLVGTFFKKKSIVLTKHHLGVLEAREQDGEEDVEEKTFAFLMYFGDSRGLAFAILPDSKRIESRMDLLKMDNSVHRDQLLTDPTGQTSTRFQYQYIPSNL
ncbi:MAG: hypothetical protein ABI876_08535 [Bacteroidota bacterium]